MKKRLSIMLALLLLGSGCSHAAAQEIKIGVCIYNASDPFMISILQEIKAQAKGMADLAVMDGGNDQNLQNGQVKDLLDAGTDVLIVNPVDRIAAVYLIRMAMKTGTPLVFINREPLPEDMALYDAAYYVGTNAQETGSLCGKLLAEYFLSHPLADKNRDGIIQFVMLKGQPGHQDAEFRTAYSIKALQDAGFKVEKLAEDSAMWERSLGQEEMSTFLASYGDKIECVICNNDEMALGAIDALKAAGYFAKDKYMPVVGVDATQAALEALREGTLLGTVLNDATNQGRAALQLAVLLAKGIAVTKENYAYQMDENHYVWIPSQQIR